MNRQLAHRRRFTRPVLALLVTSATAGALVVAVPGVARAAADTPPTMKQTFTTSVAPVPSLLASAGGPLSLTRQTITGMAAQKYGLTPGMTAAQATAVQAGFSSSLAYPTAGTAGVVASAVGVFAAHNTSPVSQAAPGCSVNTGGASRRVVVTGSGSTYRLSVSGPQSGGFRAGGSWRLPAHGSERPLAVTVLDTNCSFDASSAIAVTFPSGVDYFAYDGAGNAGFSPAPVGGVLVPTATWTPDRTTVLASAHVNSDASYLPVDVPDPESDSPDVGNVTMLVVTGASDGSVALQRLELTSLQPGGGQAFVQETGFDVAFLEDGPITGAALAYDNRGQGSINDSSYALAVRSGGVNHVWFGLVGRSVSPPDRVISQDGACAGNALPQLSVATAPGINGSPFTGVVCTVQTSSGTVVQRWSDYTSDADDPSPPSFPHSPNPSVSTTTGALAGVTPFATWPCVLLSKWAADQQPARSACISDLATDLVGTRPGKAARFYQLPVIGGPGGITGRDIAGATPGAVAVVDQLPLARTSLKVTNDSTTAVSAKTAPVPVVYMMPAPMIDGLTQLRTGAPVAFGTATGTGTSGGASFGVSAGATVSATIGDPTIAALQLSASADRSTRTTDTTETTTVSEKTISSVDNRPLVVYTVSPVWQWTGTVTGDSTGVGTTNHIQVLTQIAKRSDVDTPMTLGESVPALASQYPDLFAATGTYGPTLISIYGPGVFGGTGPTVAGADPGAYPYFTPGSSLVPRQADGATFCDTPTGRTGVTSINSGVPSPYTEPDVTAGGQSYLTAAGGPTSVTVGSGSSDREQVTVLSSRSVSYSTDFSVNTSVGATIGGVGVTLDTGFTIGNQTSVSTSSSQNFAVEIGQIKGAAGPSLPTEVSDQIDQVLRQTQTYTWEPFMCRRTTALPGGGQTSGLVLGFATAKGFTGLPDVAATGSPTAITGSTSAASAPTIDPGSTLQFRRSGPAGTYRVDVKGTPASNVRTLWTPVVSPAASTSSPVLQTVQVPSGLAAGTYSYRPSAVSFNGVITAGTLRYFRIA